MELIFFIFCVSGVVLLGLDKRIKFFSPYYFFVLFCLLYSVIPLLIINDIYPPATVWLLSLSQRKDLLDIHLLNIGIALISFAFAYAAKIGATYKQQAREGTANASGISTRSSCFDGRLKFSEKIVFVSSVALLLVAAMVGFAHPWGSGVRPPLIDSFLAQIKVILSAVFCYFFARFKFSFITTVILIGFAVVTLIEGSRTSLISIVIALLIITAKDASFKRNLGITLGSVLAFLFFVFIALNRLNINASDIGLFDAAFPVYIEGMYGSYMCLQTYEVMSRYGVEPTWGITYLVDPVSYLIPRFVFVFLGENKEGITIFSAWTEEANKYLSEDFAPYGGFFFIANAYAALPYLGPAIISGIFGYLTAYFEKKSFDGFLGQLWYLNFLVGFFMVFIKHEFSGSSHFFFTVTITNTLIILFVKYFGLGFSGRNAYPSRRMMSHSAK